MNAIDLEEKKTQGMYARCNFNLPLKIDYARYCYEDMGEETANWLSLASV